MRILSMLKPVSMALGLLVLAALAPVQAQGLSKSLPTAYGIDAAYWQWSTASLDRNTGKVWFVMRGFASKADCDAGRAPLAEVPFTIQADKLGALFQSVDAYLVNQALTALRGDQKPGDPPMFQGATPQ